MREIRSHGSVRGVRSNPYPYRDITHPHAEGMAPPGAPRRWALTGGKWAPITLFIANRSRIGNRPSLTPCDPVTMEEAVG